MQLDCRMCDCHHASLKSMYIASHYIPSVGRYTRLIPLIASLQCSCFHLVLQVIKELRCGELNSKLSGTTTLIVHELNWFCYSRNKNSYSLSILCTPIIVQ